MLKQPKLLFVRMFMDINLQRSVICRKHIIDVHYIRRNWSRHFCADCGHYYLFVPMSKK